MTAIGVMASAVVIAAGTDVLLEPFNNLTAWTGGTGGSIVAGGRTGNAVEFTAFSGGERSYTIPTGDQSDTVTVGFAWRPSSINQSEYTIMAVRSDAGATDHDALRIDSANTLKVLRGTSSPVGTSAAGVIPTAAIWYYIELQVKLHDTLGTVEVRVNGTPVIATTGQDTKSGGTKTVFDTVRLVPQGFNSSIVRFDDLYVTTGAGAPFKGSITIP